MLDENKNEAPNQPQVQQTPQIASQPQQTPQQTSQQTPPQPSPDNSLSGFGAIEGQATSNLAGATTNTAFMTIYIGFTIVITLLSMPSKEDNPSETITESINISKKAIDLNQVVYISGLGLLFIPVMIYLKPRNSFIFSLLSVVIVGAVSYHILKQSGSDFSALIRKIYLGTIGLIVFLLSSSYLVCPKELDEEKKSKIDNIVKSNTDTTQKVNKNDSLDDIVYDKKGTESSDVIFTQSIDKKVSKNLD